MTSLQITWSQVLQKDEESRLFEIDLGGKTISDFGKPQQTMHVVSLWSPKPCLCCNNTWTLKITLEDKTNEIAEIASMLLKPLQSSFHASKSARFESRLQQNGELTCEANQLSMHFPSRENINCWSLFTRVITDCPRNWEETDAGKGQTAAGDPDARAWC
jgi:hypothetical protein